MFIDCRMLTNEEVITADICIIGAGAAGITIARELIGSGLSVCLLEAGGLTLEESDQGLSNAVNTGLPYGGLNTRVRAFGGTTHYWAGMCAPLSAEDFEQRSWLPFSGWPITLEELEPFYRQAQETCEVGYLEYDAQVLSARGERPLLPLRSSRVETVVYQNSPPTRFGSRYYEELEASEEIRVYLHATLTKMILNEAGTRVNQLEVSSGAQAQHLVVAQQFCLAMGGIENARHLLAHTEVNPNGLGNRSGTLGMFIEHPHYLPSAYVLLKGRHELKFYKAHRQRTFDDSSSEGRETIVYGALSLPAEIRDREELVAHACTIMPVDLEEEFAFADADLTASREGIKSLMRHLEGDFTLCRLNLRAEQRPTEACRLSLDWSTQDELGLPIVELNWQVADVDHQGYQRTLALIGAELGAQDLGRLFTPVNAERRYAPGIPTGGWHHMGTTRMSTSSDKGIVNSDCRMHDVENLYIAGSSVFPTGGYVNPTLTIVALAHRLGALLKELNA